MKDAILLKFKLEDLSFIESIPFNTSVRVIINGFKEENAIGIRLLLVSNAPVHDVLPAPRTQLLVSPKNLRPAAFFL